MNKQRLQELFEEEQSKTQAAKRLAQEMGVEYTETFRKRANKIIVDMERSGAILHNNPANDFGNETTTETNQYQKPLEASMPSAWSPELNRFYTIEEYCDTYGLDKNSVKSSKLVSHNASHMVYNIAFFTEEEEAVLDVDKHLDEIISKYVKPSPLIILKNKKPVTSNTYFDRLVYTDTHIGMDVQGKGGSPLYDGVWNENEVMSRLAQMVSFVEDNKSSDVLFIDDLGDFLDGLNGQTTRKGHELPQNMTNVEAFELGLKFKVALVDSLVDSYEHIVCNNVTNDNHSGDFAYFVSSASKGILEQRYGRPRVAVNTIQKFMHHYSVGNHTFVLCHGKDNGDMKFGFKPFLDAAQAEKIDQYCKENTLYNGNFIEFSKGDSHQAIYDDTTSNDFSYYNYLAFSPPSNWVKTNFKKSKSGFRFFNIHREHNEKIHYPYFFK